MALGSSNRFAGGVCLRHTVDCSCNWIYRRGCTRTNISATCLAGSLACHVQHYFPRDGLHESVVVGSFAFLRGAFTSQRCAWFANVAKCFIEYATCHSCLCCDEGSCKLGISIPGGRMSSQTASKFQVPLWRVLIIYGLLVAVVVGITSKLLTLQVFGENTWTNQAIRNYTQDISDPAARGIIYDRNGYVLARNVASYNVVITPAALPDDDADIQRIYREISELTGVPAGGPVTEETLSNAKLFSACIPGPSIADMVALGESLAPYTPVKIACNISEELARIMREKSVDWPGVSVEVEPIRDYPTGSLTADIVGFLGPIPEAHADA